MLGADGEHRRQADRGVHRVAPADPVPEAEHVGGVDAELRRRARRWSTRRRSAWRPPPRRPSLASAHCRAERALVIVSSVVNVFEETMNSVSSASRSRVASTKSVAVDVGDEAEGQVALAVVAQRLVRHHRPEVGAADADVDDVADRLAGVPLPLRRSARGRRRRAMRSSTSWTSATTSSPSTIERLPRRHAQRDVQHRRGSRRR